MGPGTGYPQGSPSVKLLPPAKFHILKFLECQRTAPPAGNLLWCRNLGGALHVYLDHMVSRSMTMTPQTQRQVAWKSFGEHGSPSIVGSRKIISGDIAVLARRE